MKCVSVIQPWATLIVGGFKLYETRGWKTNHRGPMLIHASTRKNPQLKKMCEIDPFRYHLELSGFKNYEDLPRGMVIGQANLIDCVDVTTLTEISDTEKQFGDFRAGRWAWRFIDPTVHKYLTKVRGSLGIFDIEMDTNQEPKGECA